MKKNLLTFLIFTLMSVFVADAAKIYFQNTKKWSAVYAYTWAPSDDATSLDALTTISALDVKNGKTITLYVKETNKENIVFLNKSSMLAKDKEQTSEMIVVANAVYDANSAQIGTVKENEDGTYVFEESSAPTVYESGLFISYKSNGSWTGATEFVKSGNLYIIRGYQIPDNTDVKIYFAADNKQIGPTESGIIESNPVDGVDYTVEYNDNLWKTLSDYIRGYDVVYNSETNTVNFKSLYVRYFGVFRNDSGIWGTPMELTRPDIAVANLTLTFDAGESSQFALFRGYADKAFNCMRCMPVGDGVVTGDYTGRFTGGTSSTWILDNEVPFGTWTVNVINEDNRISFTRNVQAIIVNAKPYELTDGSWSGALAEGDAVDFNINGTYYTVGELTAKQEGTNLVYTGTLVEGRDGEINFTADDATVTVDGLNVTITATGAFKPQMTVGSKTIDLAQSGNFLVAYDVNITNDDAISFSVDGKNYVPEMPESIRYEAYSVTIPLKEEEGSVTFANVKNEGGKTVTPFITDTFTPNIRVAADASAVTFVWDAQTAVEAIEADNAGEAVYYNLQGIRVENPANGLFVKVSGGKAMKVRM